MRVARRALLGVLGLLAAGLFVAGCGQSGSKNAKAEKPETVKVTRGDVRATVVASGTVQAETSVDVKSNAGGEVTSLLVDVGDVVKKGDLLATIDPSDSQTSVLTSSSDLQAARATVSQARAAATQEQLSQPGREREAEATIRNVRAKLRETETSLDLQRQSSRIDVANSTAAARAAQAKLTSAGTTRELDTGVVTAELAQARHEEADAVAKLAQAQSNYELQQTTYETTLRRAKEALRSAKAKHDTAKVQSGTRPSSANYAVQQAEASLRAATEQMRRLQESTHPTARASAQGEYETARVALTNAQTDLRRQKELLAKGFVTQQSVEQKEAELAAARGRLTTAEETLRTLKRSQETELAAARASVEQAEASRAKSVEDARDAATAPNDLTAAEATVRQAEADLEAAQSQAKQVEVRRQDLVSAQATVARTREATKAAGSRMLTRDVRSRDVEQAEEARRQAVLAHEQALANRRNVRMKEEQVRQLRAQLAQAEGTFIQVRAQRYQVPQKRGAIQSAQATVTRRQAELKDYQKQLRDTVIRAPRDGVVTDRWVERGTVIASGKSSVAEGTKIVTIADNTKLYCNAEVDESQIGQVKEGLPASLKIEAFRDTPVKAAVHTIYPKGHVTSDVTYFTVKMSVDPKTLILRPGMTCEIEIETQVKKNVLMISPEAIKDGPKGLFVQVLRGGKPVETPVTVGLQTTDKAEVVQGLAEGDEVIIPRASGDSSKKGKSEGKDAQKDFQKAIKTNMGTMRGK